MKILYIYLFQGLGDAVLLLPILAGFQANNPDVDLGVLVRNRTAEVISRSIFRGHVHILDEILVSQEFTNLTEPLAPPKRRSRREVYLAYRAIQNELNEVQYDIAVDATYKMGINSQRLLKCSGANSLYGWVKTEQEAKRRCLSGWIVDNRFDGSMHWASIIC
jgi:ADP-heptose:LPS heptosyltransferase